MCVSHVYPTSVMNLHIIDIKAPRKSKTCLKSLILLYNSYHMTLTIINVVIVV